MRRLTAFLAALVLVAACADDPTPEVESDLPEDDAAEAGTDDEPDADAEGDEGDGSDEGEDDADDADEGDSDEGEDGADEDGDASEDDPDADGEAAPTPDPDALEDPCADFDEGVDELLALVAPVDDQQVDDELELVGCAQVSEGTVQYRLLDGDGATLDEGFTTAECGGPCVGEFRETVSLEAAEGEPVVYVQVYWEDMADGSERDLIERIVVLDG